MDRVRNRPKHERHHVVVPLSELQEIQRLTQGAHERREEQEERERLKELSEQRVKHWPNTIEALRLKKEQDRKERFQREERLRREVDEQEAQLQAEVRKAAIDRANLILYEQDDRIKAFHQKMFLANVLEERQKQLEITQQRKKMEEEREAMWNEQLQEQLRLAKEKEEAKQERMKAKAKLTQQMQREQLEDAKKRFHRDRDEDKMEGLAIRKAAERAIVEELEEDQARRAKARDLARDYDSANVALERAKAEQQLREEEAELKIQKFAQLKEEQMAERRRRADEKFRAELERRERMIQRQAEHLAKLRDVQEERLLRQRDDLERKQEKDDEAERQRKLKNWQDIQASRTRQLRIKDQRRQREQQEREQFQHQWAQAAEQLVVEEMESKLTQRQRAKRLLDFQKMQLRERDAKQKLEKEQDAMEREMMRRAMEEEEEMFQKYVSTVMGEYSSRGRDLSALRSVGRRGNGAGAGAERALTAPA